MKLERLIVGVAVVAAVAFAAPVVRGEPAPDVQVEAGPEIAPRPWLYLDDPLLAAPMHALAFSRATYTADPSPTRPFGANISRPGAVVELGAEAGLLPRLSLAASAFGGGDQLGFGALAGLRWAPFDGTGKATRVVVSGGWLRELDAIGSNGAWLRFAITQDIRRLRLGATLHGEHVFATGRDPIDVLVMAGASYAIAGPLRAGIEYVAQDIEETFGSEAEAGARQFLGPQMQLDLFDRRLSVAGGPAFGIGQQSPTFSGRLSVAYEY